jgi:hypothetical protein
MNLKSVFLILGMFAFSAQASNDLETITSIGNGEYKQLLNTISSSMAEQRTELITQLKKDFEVEIQDTTTDFAINFQYFSSKTDKNELTE